MQMYKYIIISIIYVCVNIHAVYSQKIIEKADKYIKEVLSHALKDAKKGNPECQYMVGIGCLNGVLFEYDEELGWYWMQASKKGGYAKAWEFYGDHADSWKEAKSYYEKAIILAREEDSFSVDKAEVIAKIHNYSLGKVSEESKQKAELASSLYNLGDYAECSLLGDTIDNINNVYDALLLCASAKANHALQFEETKVGSDNPNQLVNGLRKNYKLDDAVIFLRKIEIDVHRLEKDKKYLHVIYMRDCALVDAYRILGNSDYKTYVNEMHSKVIPLLSSNCDDYIKMEMLYYEMLYHFKNKNINEAINQLNEFEHFSANSFSENKVTRTRLSFLYFKISDLINYYLEEYWGEFPILREIALNTLIHCRDFAFEIQLKRNRPMVLVSWRDVQKSLQEGELACTYYVYTKGLDSWNHGLYFNRNSEEILPIYGGHSNRSEQQTVESITKLDIEGKYKHYTKLFFAGTNSMSILDITNDSRFIRLKSLSEITNYKRSQTYKKGIKVLAVGDLSYSNNPNMSFSEDKGSFEVGELKGSKEEIKFLSDLFKQDVNIVKGYDFTKNTLSDVPYNIVHLSTHGTFNKHLLNNLNSSSPVDGQTGDNILKSCGLMLSNYNEDEEKNFLSAFEIKELDFKNVDIVFISACESGASRILQNGCYSVADAFYLAGAKKIIAVIDPISDKIATRFGEYFYKLVVKGKSYHDAFYIAKSAVCPNDRIIIWE